jgi:hypothetical protein
MTVDVDDVRKVVEWVRSEIGVPFVVVGGSAILLDTPDPIVTKDVDVLVSGRDLERADRAVEGRSDAPPLDPATGTIRGTKVPIGDSSIDIGFLSASAFGGQPFLEYVRTSGSVPYDGTRRAKPAVVFYMRLLLDEWEANIPSIERDIGKGIPETTLDRTISIASRFGKEKVIRQRVAATRRILKGLDADPDRSVRRE